MAPRRVLPLLGLLAALLAAGCGGSKERPATTAQTGVRAAPPPEQAVAARTPISPRKAIWGPAQLDGVSQFPIYRQLGVGVYQYTLYWSEIARARPKDPTDPDDPAYKWPPDMDLAVREAAKYGIQVSAQLLRTASWAMAADEDLTGPMHDGSTIPPRDPQLLADFAEAVARRYPSVHLFMVGSEPIRYQQYYVPISKFLEMHPNASQRRWITRYAEGVDAVYGRLKGLSRRNRIIAGNTTTSGNISPIAWIKALRLPDGKPPRMDFYGHNPFGTRAPDLADPQIEDRSLDFSDLDTLHGLLERYLQRDGRNRRLRVFLSEYSAPTDEASYEFPYHVTRAVQASWLQDAFDIVHREPWIAALGWASLYDHVPGEDSDHPTMSSNTGLIDARGVRKPSFSVFERARP